MTLQSLPCTSEKTSKQYYLFVTDVCFVQGALRGWLGYRADFLLEEGVVKLKAASPCMVTKHGG